MKSHSFFHSSSVFNRLSTSFSTRRASAVLIIIGSHTFARLEKTRRANFYPFCENSVASEAGDNLPRQFGEKSLRRLFLLAIFIRFFCTQRQLVRRVSEAKDKIKSVRRFSASSA